MAARPVCRIVVRNGAGRELSFATGFMVSPRLLLTNWHVFRSAAEATNGVAEFDYRLDIAGNPLTPQRFLIEPELFYTSNMKLDYALLAVNPVSIDGKKPLSAFGYHRLVTEGNRIEEGEWITIIQHPGGARRQFAIRENQLIEKEGDFLWYASDTAPGSSGAPAFNDSFQVVALHHSGRAQRDGDLYVLKDGRKITSLNGVDDSDVEWEANEGLRISVLVHDLRSTDDAGNPFVTELEEAMKGTGDVMTQTLGGGGPGAPRTDGAGRAEESSPALLASSRALDGAGAGVVFNIQQLSVQTLQIGSLPRVAKGVAGAIAAASPAPPPKPVPAPPVAKRAADVRANGKGKRRSTGAAIALGRARPAPAPTRTRH